MRMKETMSVATAEIYLPALRHNIQCFRQRASKSQIMAIVKGNAYGHGLSTISRFLEDYVDGFGVARTKEALHLRTIGIKKPIILLEGFFPEDELTLIVENHVQVAVHSPWQLERICHFSSSDPISVWFKIDTGMHRLGFSPQQALPYLLLLSRCKSVAQPITLFSHFCNADDPESSYTRQQHQVFLDFMQSAQQAGVPITASSIAASSGLLEQSDYYHSWIRPGISCYGISPFTYTTTGKATGAQLGLQAAMTLKSEIIAIRTHIKGDAVGYNQCWRSLRNTMLGVVAIGYGDGYPRNIPNGVVPVVINGNRYPIVGRISMDTLVVDLGPNTTVAIGDEVILWGSELPVEEIAALSGLTPYELVTRLTERTQLLYTIDSIP